MSESKPRKGLFFRLDEAGSQELALACENLQKCLGYVFRNQDLLLEALTHSTFAYEHKADALISNERLEFLGDAVLDLAVSDAMFQLQEMHDEGFMTKTRALVVCENSLALIARKLNLGSMLLLGKGEAATGGHEKPSNLANAMEAVFGAIYLDAGFEAAKLVILQQLAEPIQDAIAGSIIYDHKSRLLEYVQSLTKPGQIRFTILEEQGPVHERLFTAGVLYNEQLIASGSGGTKKEAEQQAAKSALTLLSE